MRNEKANQPHPSEVITVLATGGYTAIPALPYLPFILVASLSWQTYIIWRLRREPGDLVRWGFSRQGLAPTSIAVILGKRSP